MGSLTFRAPDNVKYPSMDLSYAAGRAGGTMTGVLSAANEQAVEMFIDEKYVAFYHANTQSYSTIIHSFLLDSACIPKSENS